MKRIVFLTATLCFPFSAMAAWFGAQFTADMVSYNPEFRQWQAAGKLYVGKDKMRMDMGESGQQLVTVYDARSHEMYSVNPAQRAYMEMPVPEDSGVPLLAVVSMPGEPDSPCQEPKISCKRVGEEQLNGVTAEKWEMVDDRDPQATLRYVEWIDPKRQILVKLQAPGGAVTERKFLGTTTIGDRKVDKWEVTVRQGDATQASIAYVDPGLKALVRQESNGRIMALTDIKVAPQPDKLFAIPSDFRKVSPEEAQRMGGSAEGMGMGPPGLGGR